MPDTPTFSRQDEVDFVIIGSGAAGGIIAKELSTAGFKIVVLEQGKYRKAPDFTHDEIKYFLNGEWIPVCLNCAMMSTGGRPLGPR